MWTILMILFIIILLLGINEKWNIFDVILAIVVTAGIISHFTSYQISLNNYLITITITSIIGLIFLSLFNQNEESK